MNPNDFGPIYAETDMSRFPVEPWNTASNLVFLVILVYFALATRFDFRRYRLIVLGLPILLVGFVGGTIFHATRSDNIWLLLDFLPILILTSMAALFLWAEITGSFVRALLCVLAPIAVVRLFGAALLPRGLYISFNYGTIALVLLFPAFLCAIRMGGRGLQFLTGALLLFSVALTFRILDSTLGRSFLPMGTHFLWHLFGGVSVFLLMKFLLIWEDRKISVSEK